jgi:YD repeat-containing protein
MSKPYTEHKVSKSVAIRTFSVNADWSELRWHWDEEDRLVEPLNDNDWQFQFDNELPQRIYKEIFIPAGMIHRVIQGSTDLVVKITKYDETPKNI